MKKERGVEDIKKNAHQETLGVKFLEQWRRRDPWPKSWSVGERKCVENVEKVARLNKRRKVAVLQLGPWTSNVFFAEKSLDDKLRQITMIMAYQGISSSFWHSIAGVEVYYPNSAA